MDVRGLVVSAVFVGCLSLTALASNNNYNDVLNRLVPPNLSYTVKVEKNSQLKGYEQLNVSIKDRRTGTIYHRYLWISKDKRTIIPIVLKYKNGRITRVEPKVTVEKSKADISWLNDILKGLPKELKQSLGKGKSVYMFTDPYCPFCKRELTELLQLAKQNKIKLFIVPFVVHGEPAAKASALFFHLEKTKGLKTAINTIEKASFSDVTKAVKKEKDIDKIYKEYKPKLDKITRMAYLHGINGTPGMVIVTGKDEGYVLVGLQDISKYVK